MTTSSTLNNTRVVKSWQCTLTSACLRHAPPVPPPKKTSPPPRLQDMVLRWLPVTHNKAVEPQAAASALGDSPIQAVLRSKGFMWLSNKHTTAFYWSHAGVGVIILGGG